MSEPITTGNAVTQTAKAVAGAGGLFVWGLSLNDWAAIISIIFTVTLIAERLGVLGILKACCDRLARVIRG